MRKAQKKQAESFVQLLARAHDNIKKTIEIRNTSAALDLLEQCQEGAIELGGMIEESEGEDFVTIHMLEDYCELIYQIHEEIRQEKAVNVNAFYKRLRKLLIQIENSIKNDIKVRLEIAFLPYKASMWDSLESVFLAADADPDCDAYVVPIPYYERNADGTLGVYHYEGDEMPDYVPVTYYSEYSLEERLPDIIYIHNPYDNNNYVTSVDPRFYSRELKKYTECLVYVPYYATSGGMSEAQALCSAYYYADYIVMQAEKYRKYFDPALPQEKLLPLGSPKFDRLIRMCKNPPEPPESWKKKMEGRKVYFYNTSINGMLGNTKSFLKKMDYVFRCFRGREDACIVWRPHPLLESTFDSMRKELRPIYDELKRYFIENEIGIYDDTPDMTETIALCDAYIGDAGTSVTSLFGIAGKPMFILNNEIHSAPEEDDWRGEIIKGFGSDGHDDWMITQGNKLYHAPNHDYHYEYYCDLSEYASGNYYLRAMEIDGKVYVCPANAQEILVIEDREIKKRVRLEHVLEREGAFVGARCIGDYLFLIPFQYPAIVRYDMRNDKVEYIQGNKEVFVSNAQGEWRVGSNCIWNNYLLLASPVDNRVLMIDGKSGEQSVLSVQVDGFKGCMGMVPDPNDMDIWMLPYTGTAVVCWNPKTGKVQEYSDVPAGFKCKNRPYGFVCEDRPFSGIAFSERYVFFPPYWGNMFLRLDREIKKFDEWIPPFDVVEEGKNGYFMSWSVGGFIRQTGTFGKWTYRYFSTPDRKVYEIDMDTREYTEIDVVFDQEELRNHESGFCEISEWLRYAGLENAFNSLPNFLDGNISGNLFDRERQIRAYGEIAANYDGTSGEKIHSFMREKV